MTHSKEAVTRVVVSTSQSGLEITVTYRTEKPRLVVRLLPKTALEMLPQRAKDDLRPREKVEHRKVIRIPLKQLNEALMKQVDELFLDGELPQFNQVLPEGGMAETHYGKFVIVDDVMYVFSENDLTHWQAYRMISSQLQITGTVQSAGTMYIAFEPETHRVVGRTLNGGSESLEAAGKLNWQENLRYRESVRQEVSDFISIPTESGN